MKRKKVLVFSNLIYPLRVPLFQELCIENDYNFLFVFLQKNLQNRKWNVVFDKKKLKYIVLPGFTIPMPGSDYFALILNWGVFRLLNKEKPEMIISIGWAHIANICAWLYCMMRKIPFVIWNESTQAEVSKKRLFAYPLVKKMITYSTAFFASSTKARDYLISLGASLSNIYVLGNAIDNVDYANKRELFTSSEIDILKKHLQLNGDAFVFLFVGRLEKVKNIQLLLESFVRFSMKNSNTVLLVVGYGSLKVAVEEFILKHPQTHIRLIDTVFERDGVVPYYAVSDVLILPSRSETWGYVVNEALATGIPVIVSDVVGCSGDLVRNNMNGLIFKNNNGDDLISKMTKIYQNPHFYRKLKNATQKSVKDFTYSRMKDGIMSGINHIFTEKE